MSGFLTTEGLGAKKATQLLDLADRFLDVLDRPLPKVPALRGKTIGMLFFEDSTRTRMSFDRAAKALSADTMNFAAGASSLSKGESLKDTSLTVKAMGPHLLVIRHRSIGAPWRVADWTELPVVNAGDGAHQHPTQALLDALTVRRQFGALQGLTIAIVGDIRHSRVARSDVHLFTTLGASVILVGPQTLLPADMEDWPTSVAKGIDDVLDHVDIVYLLRIQHERGGGDVFPSVTEYVSRFGLTRERASRMKTGAVVMHPGPMNRGVEIDPAVADGPTSLVQEQVTNGIAVRMAVLFDCLAGADDQMAVPT